MTLFTDCQYGSCPHGWLNKHGLCIRSVPGQHSYRQAVSECVKIGGALLPLPEGMEMIGLSKFDRQAMKISDSHMVWLDAWRNKSGEMISPSFCRRADLIEESDEKKCTVMNVSAECQLEIVSCQDNYGVICAKNGSLMCLDGWKDRGTSHYEAKRYSDGTVVEPECSDLRQPSHKELACASGQWYPEDMECMGRSCKLNAGRKIKDYHHKYNLKPRCPAKTVINKKLLGVDTMTCVDGTWSTVSLNTSKPNITSLNITSNDKPCEPLLCKPPWEEWLHLKQKGRKQFRVGQKLSIPDCPFGFKLRPDIAKSGRLVECVVKDGRALWSVDVKTGLCFQTYCSETPKWLPQSNFTFNYTMAIYTCHPNYMFPDGYDMKIIKCENSEWQMPKGHCEEILCKDEPSVVPFAVVTHNGSHAIYTCDQFHLNQDGSENTSVRCRATIDAHHRVVTAYPMPKEGTCQKLFCRIAPPEIGNATLTHDSISVTWTCKENYQLPDGSSSAKGKCYHKGWMSKIKEGCLSIMPKCAELPEIPDGFINRWKNEATYRCNKGYGLSNGRVHKTIICDEKEGWQTVEPCVEIVCNETPPDVVNAVFNFTAHQALYICKDGYEFADGSRTVNLECSWNGWPSLPSNCTEIDRPCVVTPRIEHGKFERWYRDGTVTCNANFTRPSGEQRENISCSDHGWAVIDACIENESEGTYHTQTSKQNEFSTPVQTSKQETERQTTLVNYCSKTVPFIFNAEAINHADKYPSGYSLVYKCSPGFQFGNDSYYVIWCSGTWPSPNRTCKLSGECPIPKNMQNSTLLSYGRTMGQIAAYRCKNGYQFPNGNAIGYATCSWDMNWDYRKLGEGCSELKQSSKLKWTVATPDAAFIGKSLVYFVLGLLGFLLLFDIPKIINDLRYGANRCP